MQTAIEINDFKKEIKTNLEFLQGHIEEYFKEKGTHPFLNQKDLDNVIQAIKLLD